jgi:hypothetical protein
VGPTLKPDDRGKSKKDAAMEILPRHGDPMIKKLRLSLVNFPRGCFVIADVAQHPENDYNPSCSLTASSYWHIADVGPLLRMIIFC